MRERESVCVFVRVCACVRVDQEQERYHNIALVSQRVSRVADEILMTPFNVIPTTEQTNHRIYDSFVFF